MVLSTGGFGAGSKKKKRKAASGVGALVMLSALMLYIGGMYSFALASVLAPVGAADLVAPIMAILAALMCFFFTAFSSQGILFGGKDMDILFSLPVSSFVVMLSKVMAVYLENLVFTLFLVGPAGFTYLYFTGFDLLYVVLGLLCLVFFPLLPTLLAVLASFLISLISARMKHKNVVIILLSLIGLGGIMAASFQLNGFLNSLATDTTVFRNTLASWFAPIHWMNQAMVHHDLISLALFAAICLIPFLGVVYLISISYKNILTKLLSQHVNYDYKMGDLQAASPFKALFNKELHRLFGTPMYLVNGAFGALLLPVAGIAALFYRSTLGELIAVLPAELLNMIPLLLFAAAAFCITTVEVTQVSISLEGRNLWILQEAPLSPKTIFGAKILLHLLVAGVPLLITVPMLAVAFQLDLLQTALFLLPSLALSLFWAVIGLMANLLFPRLDAPNENVVIKQSASVFICLFGGMLFLLACGFAYFKFFLALPVVYFSLIFTIFLLFLTAAAWFFLSHKGVRLFEELD